jgi:hypothetical protein
MMLAVFLSAALAYLLSLITWQHEVLLINDGDIRRVLPKLEDKGWHVVAWSQCELSRGKGARIVIARVRMKGATC